MKNIVTVTVISLLIAACSTPPKNASNDAASSTASPAPALTATQSQTNQAALQAQARKNDSVYFDFDKYTLKAEFREVARNEAEWMQSHKNGTLTLEGNTDDRGSTEYNLALGGKRAHAVHQALVALGVPTARIKDISLGEEKPRATCEEEKCWQVNRRVDFVHQAN